ncbi:hypothetical protein QQ045_020743 [Rhodiola kirilowii]
MNLTSFTKSHQVSDQFIPISVTDYRVDYEPMQLTDEDLIACALTEPFQTPQATNNDAQPNDKPATFISHSIQSGAEQPITQEATYNPQPMEEQVTTQQTQQAALSVLLTLYKVELQRGLSLQNQLLRRPHSVLIRMCKMA